MRAMWDQVASALWYALGFVAVVASAADVGLLLISFLTVFTAYVLVPRLAVWSHGKAVKGVRDYVGNLFESYAYRFTARGFRFQTCKYSLWLAFVLWLHVFLILSLWPTWVG